MQNVAQVLRHVTVESDGQIPCGTLGIQCALRTRSNQYVAFEIGGLSSGRTDNHRARRCKTHEERNLAKDRAGR
jgi:hypothetical protein